MKKKKKHITRKSKKEKERKKGPRTGVAPRGGSNILFKTCYNSSCSKSGNQILSTPEWRKNKRKKMGKQRKNKPLNPEPQRSHSALLASYLSLIVKNHVVDKLCCGVDKHGSMALVAVHAAFTYNGRSTWWYFYVDGLCCRRRLLTHLCKQARQTTTQIGRSGWRHRHADPQSWAVSHTWTQPKWSAQDRHVFPLAPRCTFRCDGCNGEHAEHEPNAHPQNEEYCSMAIYRLWAPSVRQPARQLRPVDIDAEPSFSCIRREKNQRTWDRLVTLMRKVCCQLSPFSHAQVRETRIRTMFRFVSKTEIKSRPGKWANQESPWKTKRAYSCWGQIWDPEARTSSRVW